MQLVLKRVILKENSLLHITEAQESWRVTYV